MRKKLLLINPVNRLFHQYRVGLSSASTTRFQPLGLGIIAALTPDNWEVELIDENFTDFKYQDADLVGITAFTATATRAYEIARVYHRKKIPTVIGGIHASMLPDEALRYVDTVVIGEAENIWPRLIKDFEKGTLKRVYQGKRPDLGHYQKPRRDLFNPGYIFGSIETSRGCPMNCEFCSVSRFNGYQYRQRPVDDVLNELAQLPQKKIFFVDDNLVGYGRENIERAITLFRGMIERKIKKEWFCQASMNFAQSDRLLEYAARSGCRLVFIGVEGVDVPGLKSINKKLNLKLGVENYDRMFRRINRYGIAVLGAFMYGMETDTPTIIKERTDYIIEGDVDAVQITYITPLPGTRWFERLKNEGRLLYTNFPKDWEHYTFAEVTYEPGSISALELARARHQIINRLFSYRTIIYKFFKTLYTTKNLITALWAYNFNRSYRLATVRSKKIGLKAL